MRDWLEVVKGPQEEQSFSDKPPSVLRYLPFGQSVQVDDSSLYPYFPGGQGGVSQCEPVNPASHWVQVHCPAIPPIVPPFMQ